MKKKLFALFCLVLLLVVSCSPSSTSLELSLREARKELPMEVDEGLVVTKILKENKNVIYVCEVDENLYDIDEIKDLKYEVKDDIIKELKSDAETRELLNLIKNTDSRLIYRYIGDRTNQKVDIVINNYDF